MAIRVGRGDGLPAVLEGAAKNTGRAAGGKEREESRAWLRGWEGAPSRGVEQEVGFCLLGKQAGGRCRAGLGSRCFMALGPRLLNPLLLPVLAWSVPGRLPSQASPNPLSACSLAVPHPGPPSTTCVCMCVCALVCCLSPHLGWQGQRGQRPFWASSLFHPWGPVCSLLGRPW